MPVYDRKCGNCDHTWEIVCKIVEKDDPKTCPECQSTQGEWVILSAPASTMNNTSFGNMDKKTGIGEVFDRIKKRHPRTEIAKR